MTDINPAETKSLRAHVVSCGVRYKNLYDHMTSLSRKITRLEAGMVTGMVIIIGLLAKMAFWPSG
ncbi:MAG: hypothetical protein OEU46_22880 [Alphaproteobacteria bacterium]|nr:hypothetical protein [Alphaproteobacteria bacterium]